MSIQLVEHGYQRASQLAELTIQSPDGEYHTHTLSYRLLEPLELLPTIARLLRLPEMCSPEGLYSPASCATTRQTGITYRLPALALDLETTGLNPWTEELITLQFGTPYDASIVDLRGAAAEHREELRAALQELVSGKVCLYGHNIKFDLTFLAARFGLDLRHCCIYDSMVAEQLLLSGQLDDTHKRQRVSMEATAARYGMPLSKEERDYFIGLNRRPADWQARLPAAQLRYCAYDVCIPFLLAAAQAPLLQAARLEAITAIEMRALPALAACEARGVLIDAPGWRSYIQKVEHAAARSNRAIQAQLAPAYCREARAAQESASLALAAWKAGEQESLAEARAAHTQAKEAGQIVPSWRDARALACQDYRAAHSRPHAILRTEPVTAINLKSPKQLQRALELAGVYLPSTGKAALESCKGAHPAIAELLNYRALVKLGDAFGETILSKIAHDGRIHPQYWQLGAATGRMSCVEPNWQQLPAKDTGLAKLLEAASEEQEELVDAAPLPVADAQIVTEDSIRRHCIAAPGYTLLVADFSNIEARVLAEYAQDTMLLALFAAEGDLHTETAKLMFGLPTDWGEKETKGHDYKPGISYRSAAKTINYGLMFGMGPTRLGASLGVTFSDAKELMRAYFGAYPGVEAWLKHQAYYGPRIGEARTLTGRRRSLNMPVYPRRAAYATWEAFLQAKEEYNRQEARVKNQAKNTPIQGTAADIMKLALALVHTRLPEGAGIIAVVHDELVVEARLSVAKEAAEILSRSMQTAGKLLLKRVSFPAPDVAECLYWRKG